MGKNKTLWILILVFAVVLAGASVLYQKLGSQMEREALVTEADDGSAASEEEDGSSEAAKNSPSDNEADENEENTSEKEAAKAPDFTVTDGDGQEAALSDFLGKPVVLNFWASWCGPCKSEMPDFEKLYQEYGEDIHFLMVNMTDGSRETVETAKEFLEETGYTFPVYFDTAYEASVAYGVRAIPTTYFIDAQGYAVAQAMAALDEETIRKGIGMIQ